MNIIRKIVPESKWGIKCPYHMNPEFIVIHNTANNAPAENEIAYMTRNDNEVSFHYAVDDVCAIQGLELNRNGWHSGDGNGAGNRKGIAIEICYSLNGGTKFVNSEKNGAKLVAMLLKQYSWGINKVKKHQDFSGKYCPHRTLDMGWQRFLDMVQSELNQLTGEPNIPEGTKLYKVQAGAFESKANAEGLAKSLNEKGFETYIVQLNGLYKVQLGGFSVKENAQSLMDKVKAAGVECFIATEDRDSVPKKSVYEIAREVIAGKWGNGLERKTRLEKAGYNYDEVQAMVNSLL